MSKRCSKCREVKPLSRFSRKSGDTAERRAACKDCANVSRRTWRAANSERAYAASRRWHRMKKYGLTDADIEAKLQAQGGLCPICGRDIREKPYVDHCHATDVVRDLLCCKCNVAIGMLDDVPGRARSAATYLERHGR